MPYYLGIDGGGTKTTCAVGDETRALATSTTGASNVVRVGELHARESLQSAIRQACAAAGISPAQISGTCVGASGAARPEIAAIVHGALAEVISEPIEVVGDMEIALEAAFGAGAGVVVIAGTGSIAFGRDQQGNTARAGGWGFAISDEGSAHWIGRAAVSAVLRENDMNSRPVTDQEGLAASVCKAWGVRSVPDLVRAANSIPPPDFAALFRVVVASNDTLAGEVLSGAGRELAHLATVVIERLFPETNGSAVPVAVAGGVFRHSNVVREAFYNELRRLVQLIELHSGVVEPVEGALRRARRAGSGKAVPKT
ncbi:MAG TPA: BadF/BadG/BcrA/BcrD ATPase family protein [Candidatus Sulfotelmatobacter sp.]|nr:BadF/BadG/BcrA/BcrD ATPase family protein [Candidatus Sulfotelmatobacter sp.]